MTIIYIIVVVAVYFFTSIYITAKLAVTTEEPLQFFGCLAVVTGIISTLLTTESFFLLKSKYFQGHKIASEFTETDMMDVLQEEGYFPQIENDGDVVFIIKGTTFTFGHCANGFVYGRLHYTLNNEDCYDSTIDNQSQLHIWKAPNSYKS